MCRTNFRDGQSSNKVGPAKNGLFEYVLNFFINKRQVHSRVVLN